MRKRAKKLDLEGNHGITVKNQPADGQKFDRQFFCSKKYKSQYVIPIVMQYEVGSPSMKVVSPSSSLPTKTHFWSIEI